MDERDPSSEATAPDDDQDVRELLSAAGRRPAIPQEDLDAIREAARSAWRSAVGGGAETDSAREGGSSPSPLGRRRSLGAALGLAAALAVVAGLAWWWRSQSAESRPTVAWAEAVIGSVRLEAVPGVPPSTLSAGAAIPSGAVLSTKAKGSGRAALRLAGGTTVRLDAGSLVRCVSAEFLELHAGALYFDTGDAPPAERARGSVLVWTPLGTVRDVGTRFAVRVENDDRSAVFVRVRNGAVRTEHHGRSELTPAGQELELRRDGSAERRPAPAYGPAWDWVLEATGGYPIEGRTLRQFLDWVARETGWQVVYADPEVAAAAPRIVLHGDLGGLRADRAAFAVLPGAGLAGELRDGTLVIRRLRAPK
jgi:ferric-dicitrate binding protein FerR (iron transport regulator)